MLPSGLFTPMLSFGMLEEFLQVSSGGREDIKKELIRLLTVESVIPSFSEAALKLCILAQDENATIEDFTRIISTDPGLAVRCIRVASTVAYAARPIDDIRQAVSLIGSRKIRRIAFAVATIDTFAHLKVNIDWRRFWLHNVLVGRLTDRVAGVFREPSGMEYLAGLLHDIGKLLLEHYFPAEFDTIVIESARRKCGHAAIERELLGFDHAQIGAAVCQCLSVHQHIVQAVWFHHRPLDSAHTSNRASDGGFLAACISVANKLAHAAKPYSSEESPLQSSVENTSEWSFLSNLARPTPLQIDLKTEMKETEEELQAFL